MVTADEVRRFALSLPEAAERAHWGKPAFNVRNKIFAVIQEDGASLVVKTDKDDRMMLTAMDPQAFSVPASFSNLNYMLVNMRHVDFDELRGLLINGWRLVAPKRLIAEYEGREGHGEQHAGF